jgi:hypothetical protein
MADDPTMPEPADWRRAGALITHRASTTFGDLHDGVRAILEEAATRGRLTRLLRAVDAGYRIWVNELRTERSRALIDELIDDVATQHNDPYTQYGAQAIRAMRNGNAEALLAVLHLVNADDEGGSRLIGAVSDVYSWALPELATPTGRQTLNQWTVDMAQYDDGDG